MVSVYTNSMISNLKKKSLKNLTILILIVVFTIIFEGALLFLFSREPYGTPYKIYYQIVMYSFAIIAVFSIIFFIEIVYLKCRRYYVFIIDSISSQRSTSEGTVIRVNEEIYDKKGVQLKSIDLLEWSKIKNDYVERTVNVDANHNTILKPNDMITIITSNGVLLAYEIKNI